MKKRMISLILVLALMTVVLPSGIYVGMEVFASTKKVTSISVKSKPTKLNYKLGGSLSTKGLKLTVKYSNKSKKTVSSGFTCSPTKLSKVGTQKITVKYKGKKTSFNVAVKNYVTSVRIKSKPTKLAYKVGEKLSPDGLKLTVTYASKSTKIISSGFTCTPSNFSKAGTQRVTVKYGGKSASFNVTVSNPAVQTTTAKTTTTTAKTTTATQPKKNNMQYIKSPDYKSKYYIVVYTGSQSAAVYGKDSTGGYSVLIKCFTVSTGKKGTSPTKTGMYKIKAKYRWRLLVGPCYGQYCNSIGNNYLFHSVPYDKQRADTLQDDEYDKLGRDASHGCIRMCVRDSKWIYDNCPIGTQVNVVTASGPAGAGVPKRNTDGEFRGWDPSDKWTSGNPYLIDLPTTSSAPSISLTTDAASTTSETSETSAIAATTTTSSTSATPSTSASPTSASSVASDNSATSPTAA